MLWVTLRIPVPTQVLKGWGPRVEFLRIRPYETTSPAPPLLLDTISKTVNKAWLRTSYNNLDFSDRELQTFTVLELPQRQEVLEEHCLPMTAPVLWLKILSELCSATFCCSVIKWRSTPSICWIYIKLGLHAGRCLLCNLKNTGSWGSAAQSIQVDGPQECSSSHCQLPSNADPTQLLSWSLTIMLQCQCNTNTVLEEQTQPKSPISCSCFRKLSISPQNSD